MRGAVARFAALYRAAAAPAAGSRAGRAARRRGARAAGSRATVTLFPCAIRSAALASLAPRRTDARPRVARRAYRAAAGSRGVGSSRATRRKNPQGKPHGSKAYRCVHDDHFSQKTAQISHYQTPPGPRRQLHWYLRGAQPLRPSQGCPRPACLASATTLTRLTIRRSAAAQSAVGSTALLASSAWVLVLTSKTPTTSWRRVRCGEPVRRQRSLRCRGSRSP